MKLSTIAKWVVLGVLFLIPFLPLYVDSSLFFPFITSKGFAFRILIGLGAGAYVLLALLEPKYRPRFSWTLALYGAFVAWMAIANFFAVNPHKAFWSNFERMDGWVTMIHAFLFFIVAGSVLSADKLWKRWWQVVLAASVLVSLHGLWQIMGFAEIHQGGMRVDANFGNAIYFAVYLMFTIGIALWQAFESKGWLRYALIALAVVQLFLVFMSATRGVILALAGAAGLVALAFVMTGAGKKARTGAVAVIAVLVIAAGSFYLARDSAFVKSEPALARLSSVFETKELTVRLALWGMAFEGFLERPVAGWGQEGYNYVFNAHYRPSLMAQEPWFDRSHNTYLDWLVAGGAPALFLFIALLLVSMRALYRADASRHERILLAGILAAYALQAVTAFDNLFSYILLAALLAMAHERSSKPIPALADRPAPTDAAGGAVALPVVLVVTIGAVWMVNVPNLDASKDLIRAAGSNDPVAAVGYLESARARGSFAGQEIAEQMITFASNIIAAPQIPNDVKQKAFELAFTTMQGEIMSAPKDARLHLLFAQGLRSAGLRAEYLAEVDTALALSPKKQSILFQRGVEKWQSGDRAGAAEDFMAGYDLDRSFDQSAAYAATGLLVSGDIAGGKTLLMEHFGTTTVDKDPLRFAFYEAGLYEELLASARLRVENEGGTAESRFLLAQAYSVLGRMNEARAEIEAAIKAHPEAAAQGAELLRQLGVK